MNNVTYTNYRNNITMSGNLYFPENFNENKKYTTIVVVHPGGGVKEQTAGLYAERLAELGYVTLAFDASYQGESGGTPRYLDSPFNRVDDISVSVDYLASLSFVDVNKIGVLGICAGGGHAINAATADHRMRAVATVSAMDVGAAFRAGLTSETVDAILLEAGKQRTIEANGGDVRYMNYIPDTKEEADASGVVMLQEAYDYYRTPRGQHENAKNILLYSSMLDLYRFSAFEPISQLLTQPLLMIAGSKADTLGFSEQGITLSNGPKELYLIDGATHVALYDEKKYVDQAIEKLDSFFEVNL